MKMIVFQRRLRPFVLCLASACVMVAVSLPVYTAAETAIKATSSFKPPTGCKADRGLARAFNAVQACEQRFSPTHELAIILLEKRYRMKSTSGNAARTAVKKTVKNYIAELRRANAQAPGQSLGLFETKDALPQGLAKGAEFCTWATGVFFDRRVPNFPGDEFRIWFETVVCARSNSETRTIQLVELRASERFRVATDGARAVERFKNLAPAGVALEAGKTLRLF